MWRCGSCVLAGLERHQKRDCCCYEQRLPWCWDEEAAPWISQQLRLLVFYIACLVLGIALCWCWQCLLTVGGNWLPHTVTPCDVTTWHDAVDRPRTFYTLQNVRHERCKHHSESGQQVSSLPDIVLEVPAVCLLKISVFITMWHCILGVGPIQLTSVSDDTVLHIREDKFNISPYNIP